MDSKLSATVLISLAGRQSWEEAIHHTTLWHTLIVRIRQRQMYIPWNYTSGPRTNVYSTSCSSSQGEDGYVMALMNNYSTMLSELHVWMPTISDKAKAIIPASTEVTPLGCMEIGWETSND